MATPLLHHQFRKHRCHFQPTGNFKRMYQHIARMFIIESGNRRLHGQLPCSAIRAGQQGQGGQCQSATWTAQILGGCCQRVSAKAAQCAAL
jgi:hypothetical protein